MIVERLLNDCYIVIKRLLHHYWTIWDVC